MLYEVITRHEIQRRRGGNPGGPGEVFPGFFVIPPFYPSEITNEKHVVFPLGQGEQPLELFEILGEIGAHAAFEKPFVQNGGDLVVRGGRAAHVAYPRPPGVPAHEPHHVVHIFHFDHARDVFGSYNFV